MSRLRAVELPDVCEDISKRRGYGYLGRKELGLGLGVQRLKDSSGPADELNLISDHLRCAKCQVDSDVKGRKKVRKRKQGSNRASSTGAPGQKLSNKKVIIMGHPIMFTCTIRYQ
jgi:hypothetical protein